MDFQSVHGKMKNKDIIITINSLNDIEKLEKLGIKKYAYPLKEFCVGIPNTFLISEIKNDGYIYLNRILDNDGIDKLRSLLKDLPLNIRGIIFDDLGIIELVKDLKIEKILYLSHFNTNLESIKIYLNYVDNVIISTDITEEETKYINNALNGKLTVFVLGYVMAMYSRRYLIDNYSKFHNLPYKNNLVIENTNHKFLVYENEFGTCFYHLPLYNGLKLLNLNAKNYFINAVFLSVEDIKDLLEGTSNIEYDEGFLNTETTFKLKGDIDD